MTLQQSILPYIRLMRLDRPIGILLLLWPTLWALMLASHGHPPLSIVAIFVAGVVIMRSAGCVINDIADRKFDKQVSRTKNRPLANGQLSVIQAVAVFGILCGMAMMLVSRLNSATILLSAVGLFFAIIYPFAKRFTHFPQLLLGIAFSWSIPMAYAAILGEIPHQAWLLFITAVIWPLAYDTFYAMADRDEDAQIGVKSTAIIFGKHIKIILFVLYVLFFELMWMVGKHYHLHGYFYLSLGTAVSIILYQFYLIRDNKPQHYFQAFLNNNWVGMIIFLSLIADYYLPITPLLR